MVARQVDAVAELGAAAQLLASRWTLALPTAIASLIAGMFFLFVLTALVASAFIAGAGARTGHAASGLAFLGAGLASGAVTLIVIVVLVGLAQAIVIAASEDAWQGRPPDFGAAIGKAIAKIPSLVALFVLLALLALIPLLLSFMVIGIPLLLVLGFLMMYALPALMVGNRRAVEAIAESYHLTRAHLAPSAVAFVGIVAAMVLGRVVDAAFLHVPLLGLVVTFVVGGVTAAFAALVSVRFYDLLRTRSALG
jgi:hypothetical protein